jgi:hypothetical protein
MDTLSVLFFIFWCFIIAHTTEIIAQIIHEFGHYISAYFYGLNPYFRYEFYCIPDGVWHDRSKNCLSDFLISISGIITGIIPIIIYYFIFKNTPTIYFLPYTVILYINGCSTDMSNILKNIRGEII